MRKIGPKNSKQEIFIRRLVDSMGYRFRLHRNDLPGTPDIVFPKYKKVIFINGCFWHGHKGCKKSKLPNTNKAFWDEKIQSNIHNDISNQKKLKDLGWDFLILWQCEIKNNNIESLKERVNFFPK